MRYSKQDLEIKLSKFYGYELPPMRDILKIGAQGHFDGTCQETVPMALRCFMDANDFEEAVRLAVLCDGDTDTKRLHYGLGCRGLLRSPRLDGGEGFQLFAR